MSTKFEIDVSAPDGGVAAAAAAVEKLGASLEGAASKTVAAASAVAQIEASYRQLEVAADKAAKTEEALSNKIVEQRAKMTAAMEAGDEKAFWRAVPALEALEARQSAAAAEAARARDALASEAAAVDALTSALVSATAAEGEFAAQKAAAAQVAADAQADEDADAKLRSLEATYQLAEAERKLAEQLASANGFIKEQDRALKQQEKSATEAAKAAEKAASEAKEAEEKQAKGRSEALKASQKEMAMLATVAAVVAAAFLVAAAGIFSAVKAAVIFADKEKRIDALSKKLEKNLAKTFGGLKIDGLLDGMDTLVALFDDSTESGQALKFLFETMFQPIIDALVTVIPLVERAFLYAVLYALKAYNALKPFSAELETLGKGLAIVAAVIGGVIAASLAVFIGFILIAVAIVAALSAAFAYCVGIIWNAVGGFDGIRSAVVGAAESIKGAFMAAVEWLSSLSLVEVAMSLIAGLAGGIANGTGMVIDAIKALGSSAISALVGVLKIGSPSKVFEDLGGFTAEGFEEGVDDGAGGVQASLESMAAPPDLAAAAGKAGGKGGGGDIHIGVLNINGEDGQSLVDDFLSKLTSALEGDALSIGGGEAPAT